MFRGYNPQVGTNKIFHFFLRLTTDLFFIDIYIYIYIYIYTYIRESYYEELAYLIMRAEKFHNLPSENWRPKKASGVIQSKSEEGLRTKGGKDVNTSPRAGEDEMTCPLKQ